MIWRLALRNSLRSRRRTALVALAISLSFALLLILLGIGDGVHEKMADIGVSMGLGDVQVQKLGYADDPTLENTLAAPDAIRRSLLAMPRVKAVAPRLRTDALLTAGATSVGVALSGVDPAIEPGVSKIDTKSSMVSGSALEVTRFQRRASALPPVVIGRELARALSAGVGDRVTLTLRPAGGGETRSGAFEVHGIFATGVRDIDAGWVEIPLSDAQRLCSTGDAVTALSVFLDQVGETAQTARDIRHALNGRDVEVQTWMEAAPDLYALIVVDQGGLYAMMAIVFVVVAAGILNTLLMSILERTREFGVLLALGVTPARIVAIVMGEALVLGLAAGGTGLALGLLCNHYFATTGIDLEKLMGQSFEASGVLMPRQFFSHLYPDKVWTSSLVILGLVLLGAIYPALKAARLEPLEAIRHE